ncbi:class I SAM-dependent methyltransferase [Shumkonia mesophila]|uniref:class I SAM-dependent methyltransferase n=1 Tax=Shumkonia mesophila TaxID=2838854 RepID=UPI0029350B05|nr:class I SAM-dependent methyltransferase [Shumkonia mesophila]
MTGFSPEWLALREPADGAARNGQILAACAQAFAGRDELSVCDLGAGTGASLRAFADRLPPRQRWTLVDHDQANLAAAGQRLTAWAERAEAGEKELVLSHGERRIVVERARRDLAIEPHCWPAGTNLVTASALFDLTSGGWIGRFVAALAADRLPLLATLTFDGEIVLDPPHRLDATIAGAFRAHQEGDKGFGPAAGGHATDILAVRLRNAGYAVTVGDSPWRLDPPMEGLRAAFLDGVAAAVAETGLLDSGAIAAWLAAGLAAQAIMIGHRDLFAMPGQSER